MKKLNSDELFSIFSQGDQTVYQENSLEEVLDNSFVLFGMVVKGVENYFIIDKIYSTRYGKDYDSPSNSIKLKYFNGLIKHLERIDITRSEPLLELFEEFGPSAIKYALDELLDFYQEREYFEQCALIFKFTTLFFPKQ